jgi:hypothetical protein
MVVDDFDIEGVAIAKGKAKSPGTVNRHRPLSFPVAPELEKLEIGV